MKIKNWLILIFLLTNIVILGMSYSFERFPEQVNYAAPIQKEDTLMDVNPLASDVDFLDASKTMTKGVQVDPPFNESNILFDDDIYDSTKFVNGSTAKKSYYDATTCNRAFGTWGTTAGGSLNHASIALAIGALDGNQFWLISQYIRDYPFPYPVISMGCGGFSHINNPDIIPHISLIQIKYDIQVMYGSYTGKSKNLLLSVDTQSGKQRWFSIDQNPTQYELNSGVFYINDAELINLAKNGDFVSSIAVWLDCTSETSPWVYIGIDCLQIQYVYKTYDVDFAYKLNYGGHDLSSLEEFEVEFDVEGSIHKPELTQIYIYDFNTTEWYHLGKVLTEGLWTKTIDENASSYFNQDNDLLIRFSNYGYTENSPPSNYSISIDYVKINFEVPDKPPNFYAKSGISHIMLTWDIPKSYGIPIDHYNIYRGESLIGYKSLIANSSSNEFNDTTTTIGIQYYYLVSAVSSIGEGENSTVKTGKAYEAPFVELKSPLENETVIFGTSLAYFNFTFDKEGVEDVTLEINRYNYGSVINKSQVIIFPYNNSIDGKANLSIRGFQEGVEVANDTIHCFFSKLVTDELELLKEDTQYVGKKLYLIMHDPSGDNSYSYYEQQTSFSMAVGLEISESEAETQAIGEIVSISIGAEYFVDISAGIDVGGTSALSSKKETMWGFDYRYDFTDISSITSSIDTNNEDFIGPGYGDRYWGESWTLHWKLRAYHRTYWNGTDRYEDVGLSYGIIRGAEVYLTDSVAPAEWRKLNPVHNGWKNVSWFPDDANSQVYGNQLKTRSYEVSACNTLQQVVVITFGSEVYMKLPGFSDTLTCELSTRMYREESISSSYAIGYIINDDESTDCMVQDIGIDRNFGTFIFRTNSSVTKSSYPLEHNTIDYLPPNIEFPTIKLDSSQDGLAPCEDDSPIVTVDLQDEGGIRSALIIYSTNDGANWNSSVLSEQIANPGVWQGIIPAQDHGTTVKWFIRAWDLQGSYSNRTNPNGKPYSYTVINRYPTVSLLTPNGGEVFQDIVNIEWMGGDPDDDPVSYSLAYCLDNTGWHLIASGLTNSSYAWNVSRIASNNVLLKIIANDGDLQSEDVMDFVFGIQRPPHAPAIVPPADINYLLGSTGNELIWNIHDENPSKFTIFKEGLPLYSMDFDVIPSITDEDYEISMNVDGLGLGTYVYKIEIHDDSGFIVTDEVLITVYNNPSISASLKSYLISWNITDIDIKECNYVIYRDGLEIESGSWASGVPVEFNYQGLTPGNYEFLIYATDGTGGIGANLVFVTVESPITPEIPSFLIGIVIGASFMGVAFIILFLRTKLKRGHVKPE